MVSRINAACEETAAVVKQAASQFQRLEEILARMNVLAPFLTRRPRFVTDWRWLRKLHCPEFHSFPENGHVFAVQARNDLLQEASFTQASSRVLSRSPWPAQK
jgi:hypothetical protein